MDRLGNVEYSLTVRMYISDELEVNKRALKWGKSVAELLFDLEAISYLTERWRMRVRTVLVRIEKPQFVRDALFVKVHPDITPVPSLFVLLVLLPAQVLWEGVEGNLVAPFEAASDEWSDQPVCDVVQNVDSPEVGASSMPVSASVVFSPVNTVTVAASSVAPAAVSLAAAAATATPIPAVIDAPPAVPADPVPAPDVSTPIPAVAAPLHMLLPLLLRRLRGRPWREMLFSSRLLISCPCISSPSSASWMLARHRSTCAPSLLRIQSSVERCALSLHMRRKRRVGGRFSTA